MRPQPTRDRAAVVSAPRHHLLRNRRPLRRERDRPARLRALAEHDRRVLRVVLRERAPGRQPREQRARRRQERQARELAAAPRRPRGGPAAQPRWLSSFMSLYVWFSEMVCICTVIFSLTEN